MFPKDFWQVIYHGEHGEGMQILSESILVSELDKLTNKCILYYRFLVIRSQSLLFSDCSFDIL